MKWIFFLLGVVFQLNQFPCWADEMDEILTTAVQIYACERIHHPHQLLWSRSGEGSWCELPTNIVPLIENGEQSLAYLKVEPDDDEMVREVKNLARGVIISGDEWVGPYRWRKSGEMYALYMHKVPESMKKWIASPEGKIFNYPLPKNTRTSFLVAREDGRPSPEVVLTIENTSPSSLWIKTPLDIVLIPTEQGSEPWNCQHIERNDKADTVLNRHYEQIESGQRIVAHYPVNAASAEQLSRTDSILVPIFYRLEANGLFNVELLEFRNVKTGTPEGEVNWISGEPWVRN